MLKTRRLDDQIAAVKERLAEIKRLADDARKAAGKGE
jgi:hypothetical protein